MVVSKKECKFSLLFLKTVLLFTPLFLASLIFVLVN